MNFILCCLQLFPQLPYLETSEPFSFKFERARLGGETTTQSKDVHRGMARIEVIVLVVTVWNRNDFSSLDIQNSSYTERKDLMFGQLATWPEFD